jgi:hypothetical protein
LSKAVQATVIPKPGILSVKKQTKMNLSDPPNGSSMQKKNI